MKLQHVLSFVFVVAICASLYSFTKSQIASADPHKAIDDYMKTYERLVEHIESLNPDSEQDFPLLAQHSEDFNATAKSLKTFSEWTKNDSAMLDILNSRYSKAVSRLVSGNMENGISVSFSH